MRTIKFRIWNKFLEKMSEPKKLCIDAELNAFYIDKPPHHDFELMQFTGLEDNNAKEIYEGDILEDSLGRRKVVEYYQDGFWLNASLEGAEWSLRLTHKSSKIIGNIYEHKFLLDEN